MPSQPSQPNQNLISLLPDDTTTPRTYNDVCCPHTGIVYSISTSGISDCIGMEYMLKHPLSHINLIRQNALHFSSRSVGLTEAAGSLFTLLRHYGLLVLHKDKEAVVYKANQALGLGYTKKGLNAAVYELLVNERALSAACKGVNDEALGILPRFDLSSVLACGHESKGEEGHFVQCFKSWLKDVKTKACIGTTIEARYIKERLEGEAREQAESEFNKLLVNIEGQGKGTKQGIGDRRTIEEVLEGRVNKLVDNVAKTARRKSNDTVTVKVKGQLRYAMTHGIISDAQFKLLLKHIRAAHIPASIVTHVQTLLYKYLIENASNVISQGKEQPHSGWEFQRTMKIMTTYAWFTAMTGQNLYAGLSSELKIGGKVTANSFLLADKIEEPTKCILPYTPDQEVTVKPTKAIFVNLLDLL